MDSKRMIELAILGLVGLVAVAGAFLMNSEGISGQASYSQSSYSQGYYGYAYNQPIGECYRAVGQGTQRVFLYSMADYDKAKSTEYLLSQCRLYSVY